MGRRLTADEHLDRAVSLALDLHHRLCPSDRDGVTGEAPAGVAVIRVDSPREGYRVLAAAMAATIDAARMEEFLADTFARGHSPCGCRLCVPTGDPRRSVTRAERGCWCTVCVGYSAEWGIDAPEVITTAATRDLAEWPRGHDPVRWTRSDDRVRRLLGRHAGWWFVGERVIVVSRLPDELHTNLDGRLHRADGPAARYRDKWEVHARRGVLVPPGHVDGTLTPAEIDLVENLEVRRELIDEFGADRYVAASRARRVSKDDVGELWQVMPESVDIETAFRNRMVMVKVVDATPDANRDRRVYWLHVPPDMQTARQAVAWSFGVSPDAYQPQVET